MLLDSQLFLQRIENKGSHVFAKETRLTVGSMIKVAQGPQLLFRVYQILSKKLSLNWSGYKTFPYRCLSWVDDKISGKEQGAAEQEPSKGEGP